MRKGFYYHNLNLGRTINICLGFFPFNCSFFPGSLGSNENSGEVETRGGEKSTLRLKKVFDSDTGRGVVFVAVKVSLQTRLLEIQKILSVFWGEEGK